MKVKSVPYYSSTDPSGVIYRKSALASDVMMHLMTVQFNRNEDKLCDYIVKVLMYKPDRYIHFKLFGSILTDFPYGGRRHRSDR